MLENKPSLPNYKFTIQVTVILMSTRVSESPSDSIFFLLSPFWNFWSRSSSLRVPGLHALDPRHACVCTPCVCILRNPSKRVAPRSREWRPLRSKSWSAGRWARRDPHLSHGPCRGRPHWWAIRARGGWGIHARHQSMTHPSAASGIHPCALCFAVGAGSSLRCLRASDIETMRFHDTYHSFATHLTFFSDPTVILITIPSTDWRR